jgi:Xylose isomerase-like TIM barrel
VVVLEQILSDDGQVDVSRDRPADQALMLRDHDRQRKASYGSHAPHNSSGPGWLEVVVVWSGPGAVPSAPELRGRFEVRRREFLVGAAAPLVFPRRGARQAAGDPAKLARLAIMSLSFGGILKNANSPDSPARTLDLMDLGQMYADRFGVHNVELQHSYLPSTEKSWLEKFRARLAETRSQVSNINLEFGAPMTASSEQQVGRLQAIDLTKQWIEHAVVLGCPRVMVNQGNLTEENRGVAIAALRAMGEYGRSKGVKVSLEPRGGGGGRRGGDASAPAAAPPSTPPYVLLADVIKSADIYANVDLANFGSQEAQHAGMRALFPYTVGNTHMRLNPAQYDLPTALRMMREEFKYQGIYLVERGIPAGPDPYADIQAVRDVVLEHM